MEEYEIGRFRAMCGGVFRRVMQVTRAKVAVEPIIVELGIVGVSLVLLYAWHTKMTIGDFFAFALALMMMYDPVKKLGNIHVAIQHSSAAADRIFEIVDTEISVPELPAACVFEGPVEQVAFEDVSFSYGGEPVLEGINVSVRRGQRLALVGSSGSGKTTLVSLIPRFFDVTGGRILLNGRDLREYTLKSLRAQMGLVTQDTFLFNDTVANNIGYGSPGATREQIEDAARRAHAHDFILQMPQGYETWIGERGVRLSGGQQQRLAIARAILRNPPILILDEATSALDTESERQVQAALNELMESRTVFVIAHRLSTIVHSNRILVLDHGRIAEQGSHADLLAHGGLYKRLYDLQFQV
jgi:subfamily B ATP-binding cassette protein MsbA